MTDLHTQLWRLAITPLLLIGLAACGASAPSTTATASSAAASAAAASAPASIPATASADPVDAPAAASTTPAASTTMQAGVAPASAAAASTAAANPPEPATTPTTTTKLNLNTVTEDELLSTIPDFGTRMVREFMEYRPYISITQFRKEIGKYVDDAQIAMYEQYVYVPVDVNAADAATLQQLPGVDATIAGQLIAARPFDSNVAFLAALAEYVSSTDAAAADAYLAAP